MKTSTIKRTKIALSAVFNVISLINHKIYENKKRKYERLIAVAEEAKRVRGGVISFLGSTIGMAELFIEAKEPDQSHRSCSAKKPASKRSK